MLHVEMSPTGSTGCSGVYPEGNEGTRRKTGGARFAHDRIAALQLTEDRGQKLVYEQREPSESRERIYLWFVLRFTTDRHSPTVR
jgi:hypothetical protein